MRREIRADVLRMISRNCGTPAIEEQSSGRVLVPERNSHKRPADSDMIVLQKPLLVQDLLDPMSSTDPFF